MSPADNCLQPSIHSSVCKGFWGKPLTTPASQKGCTYTPSHFCLAFSCPGLAGPSGQAAQPHLRLSCAAPHPAQSQILPPTYFFHAPSPLSITTALAEALILSLLKYRNSLLIGPPASHLLLLKSIPHMAGLEWTLLTQDWLHHVSTQGLLVAPYGQHIGSGSAGLPASSLLCPASVPTLQTHTELIQMLVSLQAVVCLIPSIIVIWLIPCPLSRLSSDVICKAPSLSPQAGPRASSLCSPSPACLSIPLSHTVALSLCSYVMLASNCSPEGWREADF